MENFNKYITGVYPIFISFNIESNLKAKLVTDIWSKVVNNMGTNITDGTKNYIYKKQINEKH